MSTDTDTDVETIGTRKGNQGEALANLEAAINMSDLDTVRGLALDLLHLVEIKNEMIEDLLA